MELLIDPNRTQKYLMLYITTAVKCLLLKIKSFYHFIMSLVQNIIALLSLCINWFIHLFILELLHYLFIVFNVF